MTYLCVSIMVEGITAALETAARAHASGADLVEWRVDRIAEDIAGVERLVVESLMPCIVTCRHVSEGGQCEVDEQQRIALFEHVALHARPRFLDVELSTMQRSANIRQKILLAVKHPDQIRELDTSLILSTHDFKTRPADLFRRLERMADDEAAAVVKVAWTARSVRENLDAFEIIRTTPKPTIALCMGPHGLMSRVLAPKFNALLTFASAAGTASTAPGQPTVEELVDVYRFKSIDRETKVFAIIGHPTGHSLSPRLHNAGFGDAEFNGVYLPLDVAPDPLAFDTSLTALLEDGVLDFGGCSVTIPHKEHLLQFVEKRGGRIGADARLAQAANTLMVGPSGSLEARNSDLLGIVDSIAHRLGLDPEGRWTNLIVGIIGAGGMARAAAAGLAMRGAKVTVHNRTVERARVLVSRLTEALEDGGHHPEALESAGLDELMTSHLDILINATPVGMAGGPDPAGNAIAPGVQTVARPAAWPSDLLVVDTVYAPRVTPLLAWAGAQGFGTLDGMDLLIRQARYQFGWWTGRELRAALCLRVLA